MSLEHKPTNYTYSKKNLERKVTTLTLIIFEEKHILEKEAFFFFLHGKKVSRKFFKKKHIFFEGKNFDI